jgi:CrcB protein
MGAGGQEPTSKRSTASIESDEVLPAVFAERETRAPRRGWSFGGRVQADVLVVIAIGGALGAPARYEIAQLVHVSPHGFPWATFWTNLSGAFVLGAFLTVVIERFPPSRYLRPFVAIGFLGAYTTFSTLAVETATLVKDGHPLTGVGYAVVSVVAGIGVAYLGIALARLLPGGART